MQVSTSVNHSAERWSKASALAGATLALWSVLFDTHVPGKPSRTANCYLVRHQLVPTRVAVTGLAGFVKPQATDW